MSRPVGPILVMAGIAVVVASIVAGMFVIGSPSVAREQRADRRRTDDLRQLANRVDVFWTRHQRLPETVAQILDEKLLPYEPRDPESGVPYTYRVVDGKTFEVCADFRGQSSEDGRGDDGSFWSHAAGRQCFRPEAKSVDH